MRTKFWVRTVILCVCMIMAIGMLPEMTLQAKTKECVSIEGNNEHAQSYYIYSYPIKSYLSYDENQTLMKVQAAENFEGVLVEYYNMDYQLQSYKVIPQELPLFGGFYETADNYYLVTGQTNLEESADVEVFRITKYDKSWNRISSAGLYDCNTIIPFDAGSLRMTEYGKYLLIRTAHEMYMTEDGLNHQANVTIQLDTETMQITDSYTGISNMHYGYVSHSFNQFIGMDGDQVVAVDQGDGAPRAVVLMKYTGDPSDGSFRSQCDVAYVLDIYGSYGENYTGVGVGGFEISDSHYLVAGHSIIQDENYKSYRARNIFVGAVSKETNEVTTRWFTSYVEGEVSTTTPQMISLPNNEYLLLWTNIDTVYYVKLNAAGEQVSDIYTMEGMLSDCKPIVAAGNVIWYTWNDDEITFYEINVSDLAKHSVKTVMTGHQYENKGVTGGYADMVCSICGNESKHRVPDYITVWWKQEGQSEDYSYGIGPVTNVNAVIHFTCSFSPGYTEYEELEVTSSDPGVIEVQMGDAAVGELHMKKSGTATITFTCINNPAAKREYTFIVLEEGAKWVDSITLNVQNMTLKVGESQQLSATISPTDATNQNLLYESLNPSVATVDGTGMVTAKDAGTATILVTTQDGSNVWASCIVGVDAAEDSSGSNEGGSTGNDSGSTNPPENGWYEVDGAKYWYENGVRQGYDPYNESYRGKEIYDSDSDAWYWLDNVQDGAMATGKDVYQESLAGDWGDYIGEDGQRYGKWVRYDENGHMIKGWQTTETGTYFFDYTFGTMAKGYATIDGTEYYFNPFTGILEEFIGVVPENGWKTIDGKEYWYENYIRQGYSVNESYRGKEIYDSVSDAWYWLDNVQGGAKAVSKDVYQDSLAGDWGDYLGADGQRYGKWVRYDESGHMIKGWQTTENGTYYFDLITGTMAKGNVTIDGTDYYFDVATGILQ